MEKRNQPKWTSPQPTIDNLPPLKLFNSLTQQKEPFVPLNGKKVSWYGCGPTVYDASHMGHARCYISSDILRRVLVNFFGYDVTHVMNITDIDDKIIKRARQNHLFENYSANEGKDLNILLKDLQIAAKRLENKIAKETDADKKTMLTNDFEKVTRLQTEANSHSVDFILAEARDCLSDWLDVERGATVTENAIFVKLPEFWENEYHKDMRSLNILPADVLTRVREFIPQIIDYVQKIIQNGFAYESNGSVYFDTNRFANDDKHFYAKLVPTAYGDATALAEGEGDLFSGSIAITEKRSSNDFALWKASKSGEPAWDSPWGKGRPGWHIECSVMASETLGNHLDIHSGGVDLKFPHHDNELAQSEAYYQQSNWVNYFIHSGHLTIRGCKMSKSLKNFITISQSLKEHSSRRLRLAFLLHSWKDTLDYGPETMAEAGTYDKLLADFFFVVNYYTHWTDSQLNSHSKPIESAEEDLLKKLDSVKQRVFDALCDSIDTREALFAVRELILHVHSYTTQRPNPLETNGQALKTVGQYVTWLFRVFGCDSTTATSAAFDQVNYPFGLDLTICNVVGDSNEKVKKLSEISREFELRIQKTSSDQHNEHVDCTLKQLAHFFNKLHLECESGGDKASVTTKERYECELWQPWLNELAAYREKIRSHALTATVKGTPLSKALLEACDWLRNEALPELAVRLEDREHGPPAIGLVDAFILSEERAQKQKAEADRLKEKELKAAERARAEAQKAAQAAIPPSELFTSQTDLYSQFDENGIPTHDAEGKEISKGQRKKLQKLFDNQKKLYEQHCLKNVNKLTN